MDFVIQKAIVDTSIQSDYNDCGQWKSSQPANKNKHSFKNCLETITENPHLVQSRAKDGFREKFCAFHERRRGNLKSVSWILFI